MKEAIEQLDKIIAMVRKADTGYVEEKLWIRTLEEGERVVKQFRDAQMTKPPQ